MRTPARWRMSPAGLMRQAGWRLSPDPPAGGSGGSSQSGTTEGGTQAQGAAPAGNNGQGGAPLTQADLANFLANFRNGLFADVRKLIGGMMGQQQSQPQPPSGNGAGSQPAAAPPAPDPQQWIARERALTDALTDHPGLTRPQVDLIRRSFDRDAPSLEQISDYVAGITAAFAPARAAPGNGTQTTTSPGGTPVTPPNPRPASDGGAPAQPNALTTGAPVWEMTPDQVDQLIREKGWYEAGVILRTRLNRDLRGRRIYVGPNRR